MGTPKGISREGMVDTDTIKEKYGITGPETGSRAEMAPGGTRNYRCQVIFPEWEVTRRWPEPPLTGSLDDLASDDHLAAFTSATPPGRWEEVKRRLNNDPANDPLRILICTDAARESINVPTSRYDLIHFDRPWNPAGWSSATGGSTANCSRLLWSFTGISLTGSAKKTLYSTPLCVEPSWFAIGRSKVLICVSASAESIN
jgi:hypothetical protein